MKSLFWKGIDSIQVILFHRQYAQEKFFERLESGFYKPVHFIFVTVSGETVHDFGFDNTGLQFSE